MTDLEKLLTLMGIKNPKAIFVQYEPSKARPLGGKAERTVTRSKSTTLGGVTMGTLEDYYWYKAHGICPRCGQRNAARNKVQCAECAEKHAESSNTYYLKKRDIIIEKYLKNNKERYNKRKEQHLCTRCGKPLPQSAKRKTCNVCAAKNRRSYHKNKEITDCLLSRLEGGDGISCFNCGKPVKEKFKICSECYEKCCKSLEKARKAIPKKHLEVIKQKTHFCFIERRK